MAIQRYRGCCAQALMARVWPLSKKSAATWISALSLCYLVWAKVFLRRHETHAVKQQKTQKAALIEECMRSVLLYTEVEMAKPEDSRKLPEASRVYALLWDATQDKKMTAYGVDPSAPDTAGTERLLKGSIARELTKCTDLTRRSRESRGKKPSGTIKDTAESAEEVKALAEHESGEKLKSKIAFAKEVAKNL
jgi:hypothetical protein